MVKRLFDMITAATALVICGPVIVVAALAVKLSSRGPAFYCPRRTGRFGLPFILFKLRTMHVHQGPKASAVTSAGDSRVFPVGRILRQLKIDELPQLFNILRGDMSIVGPRPEDPGIVEQHYGELGRQTLTIRPGLAGVSSIYNYTHGEKLLTGSDPARIYVERLLPLKLALEVVYIRSQSLMYDFSLMIRTASAIYGTVLGRDDFPEPAEMPEARTILAEHLPDSTVRTAA